LIDVEVFVNFGGFCVRDRADEIQARFWSQLVIAPECFVADGDRFVFVSKNPDLFLCTEARLAK
jgi:hypothetical protein